MIAALNCAASLAIGSNRNANAVRKAAGIADAVKALALHAADADVQRWGCQLFCILAGTNRDNRNAVWAARGVEAVRAAKGRFPEHAKVQQFGQAALDALGFMAKAGGPSANA